MRLLLLLYSLFLCCTVFSQLTQGQVYNYEIGDIIETAFMQNTMPPETIVHNTIIDKVDYGPAITYTVKKRTYVNGPGSGYPIESITEESFTIYPNSPASHYWGMMSCLPFSDTTYMGNCNQEIWEKHSNIDTSCFEAPYWTSELYENFGGPYYYGNDPSSPILNWFVSYHLTYANTQHGGECGTEFTWWPEPDPIVTPETPEVDSNPIVRIIDIMGKETTFTYNTALFYEYADGTRERVFVVK